MSNAIMGLRLRQQLTLTPRLQQSVKLLQLSALECVQELNQAISLNPFLEEPVEEAEAASAESAQQEDGERRLDERAELDFSSGSGPSHSAGEETPDWTEWTASPETLGDSLREQLLLLGLSERNYALASLIIDALDDDGFLRQPLEELRAMLPGVSPDELETALRIVQTLEPVGIAARTLGECLSLQLQALDRETPGRDLAIDIATSHLELMAARDQSKLLHAVHASQEDVRTALDLIRGLDPRPGSKVGTFEPRAIVPDVIVRKDKKRWVVSVNNAIYPRIRVNQQYADYFRHAREGDTTVLAQHLQEARWLVRNLEQALPHHSASGGSRRRQAKELLRIRRPGHAARSRCGRSQMSWACMSPRSRVRPATNTWPRRAASSPSSASSRDSSRRPAVARALRPPSARCCGSSLPLKIGAIPSRTFS